jgi:acetyltransferase
VYEGISPRRHRQVFGIVKCSTAPNCRVSECRGERLAIITNAGGPGVMACDALIERRGELAVLEPGTIEKLNAVLPPYWSHGNPIDILGDAPPQRYADALALVEADKNVDAVLVLLTPQAMTDATASATAVIEAAAHSRKPVLAAWMGAEIVRAGSNRLHRAGIPVYGTAERAVRAFMRLLEFARNRELLYETPREVPLRFELDPAALRRRFEEIAGRSGTLLSEDDSKLLLSAYGIPVSMPTPAASAAEAVAIAEKTGYPVVLKVQSPQITHKTDVGGVALNLQGAEEVRAAFERIVESARRLRPDAEVLGVTVQRMAVAVNGVELILGMKRDPVFGPAIMCGFGGVAAEVFQDTALGLPPLNERLARRMLQSLRVWPLLSGHRGRPGVNLDQMIEILLRFSYFVAHLPELSEVDINPLLATPEGTLALDARIILDRSAAVQSARPYSHLAIGPYPDEFVRHVRLADGAEILLRPIRPEDEPMWQTLLASCSEETLRLRFGYLFQTPTHQMAARFCFIDYDREMALVAEMKTTAGRQIVGVGRLIADADHQEAEFATLVGDPWQRRGVGSLLIDACLDLCRRWGIRRVSAETAPINGRMLGMFERRGFALDYSIAPDVVIVTKDLPAELSGPT